MTSTESPIPDFVAWVSPRANGAVEGARASRMDVIAAGRAVTELRTATLHVLMAVPSGAQLAADPTGRVSLLLHGDVYGERAAAGTLAADLAHRGDAAAADLNGAFTVVAVDHHADRVFVVTDRLNLCRVFHAAENEEQWIASSQWDLPLDSHAIDETGVAWYLSNGVIHAGRTPYEGIDTLPRASVHDVTATGVSSQQYWEYGFHPPDTDLNDELTRNELLERIVSALRHQCEDADAVRLSLSGGYDSTAIALMLRHRLQVDEVRCFSYVLGGLREGTDADEARRLAQRLGYRHTAYESYRGDLVAHIQENAHLGEGMAHRCDEVDAWLALESDVPEGSRSVLLVGDHFMGDTPERRNRHQAYAPPGGLRSFATVRRLAPLLPRGSYERFRDGIQADIDRVQERSMLGERSRGFFYLDQRLGNTVFPWRQRFAGRRHRVRWPLLDNEVLDFMSTVPLSVRKTHLYHRALTTAFPEEFAGERAREQGYYLDLHGEFVTRADDCRRMITDASSRLDIVVPPDVGVQLVGQVARERTLGGKASRAPGAVLRRVRKALGTDDALAAPPAASTAELLRRLLILREALGASWAGRNLGVPR